MLNDNDYGSYEKKTLMLRSLMGLFLCVLLVSCTTSSSRMNGLSIGMTKVDVIDVLGTPESTRATRRVEFLVYRLTERVAKPGEAIAPIGIDAKYFVRLIDGKVDSYGKMGDFDSTKPFETKQEVDVNISYD